MTLDKYPDLTTFLTIHNPTIHTTDVFLSICNLIECNAEVSSSLVDQVCLHSLLDWVRDNPYHAVAETHDWLDSKGEVEELAWHQNPEPRVFGYQR